MKQILTSIVVFLLLSAMLFAADWKTLPRKYYLYQTSAMLSAEYKKSDCGTAYRFVVDLGVAEGKLNVSKYVLDGGAVFIAGQTIVGSLSGETAVVDTVDASYLYVSAISDSFSLPSSADSLYIDGGSTTNPEDTSYAIMSSFENIYGYADLTIFLPVCEPVEGQIDFNAEHADYDSIYVNIKYGYSYDLSSAADIFNEQTLQDSDLHWYKGAVSNTVDINPEYLVIDFYSKIPNSYHGSVTIYVYVLKGSE